MRTKSKRGLSRGMFALICVLVFVISFVGSIVFKTSYKPWAKEFTVEWSEKIGTMHSDLSYGDRPAQKFDLYLPADRTKDSYGLVVYLHAGGFTTGDKSDDQQMLQWLCSKGYVAAGINYTLRDDNHPDASVYSQSMEIKESIPVVIAEAKRLDYELDRMAISGGSAGGTLAMLYAYRDGQESPIPVKMLFEAVGPPSFYAEDWGAYGLDQNTEAAAHLFGVMAGKTITPQMIEDGSYQAQMKPISAYAWVDTLSPPTVIAYGAYDKICPFKSVRHLVEALEVSGVDYAYFEFPHSGHGLQNDDKIYQQYMDTVSKFLDKYLAN